MAESDEFQPFSRWMSLLGLNSYNCGNKMATVYSLVMFCVTVTSNMASLVQMTLQTKDYQRPQMESDTFHTALILDNLNFTTMAIGIHLFLLYKSRSLPSTLPKFWHQFQTDRKAFQIPFLVISGLVFIPVQLFLFNYLIFIFLREGNLLSKYRIEGV